MKEPLDDRDPRLELLRESCFGPFVELIEASKMNNEREFGAAWERLLDTCANALSAALQPELDYMTEREERFAALQPDLHGKLLRHLEDGRIVRGQLWRCSQHLLTAEALDEEACKQTEFDFRSIDRGDIDPDKKWELLQFQNRVDERVLGLVKQYDSRPEAEKRKIEEQFPDVEMSYVCRAVQLSLVRAFACATALMFPHAYTELLQKLVEHEAKGMIS